jgi:hypothetical protein
LLLHALERRQAIGDRAGAAASRANLELMGWREREHAAWRGFVERAVELA